MNTRLGTLLLLVLAMGLACEASVRDNGRQGSNDTSTTTDTETGSESDSGWSTDPCDNTGDSNLGCLFWAVDLPNVSSAALLAQMPHDQQFAVVVANTSAQAPATVSVYSGGGSSAIETQVVKVGAIATFELPTQNLQPGATTSVGLAFRIESDLPIAAYQFNPLDNTSEVYSNDASLLFPQNVLASDYVAITGAANLVSNDGFSFAKINTGGFVAVIATADNTKVTIYPTAPLYPGEYQNVVLDRGRVLCAISSGVKAAGNLSGTRVVADQKVAVFSGSVATSEPSTTTKCCADHVEHQMLPLSAWGNAYAVAPAADAKGKGDALSLYRVSAGFDGTQLEYFPFAPTGAPTTLDAYETAEFTAKAPFVVVATDPMKSFSVTQFLLSNQMFGSSYPGDPSMIVLPGVDQLQPRYVFLIPKGYNRNVVTVVRRAGIDVSLDGAPVAVTFATLGSFGAKDYEYAHVQLQTGNHVIESEEPLAITVVGYSQDVSFGYPGGSGVAEISDIPDPPI
ncbi:MAG: IgGFc-binding protein [Myxococcota bacterium]|nr:IgGFc-binding protein [Myxococcota bacterium]